MRRASQGILFSLVLASSVRAQAQEEEPPIGFGDKGHFAIAAERMFGYVHVSHETTVLGMSTTTTFNSISLLGSPVGSALSFYTVPRVGFDAFVAPSVSVGGSLTYFRISSSASINGNDNALSGFLVAPRLGYAARLAPSVWLWPRAGITYVRASESSQTISLFAATIDAPLVLALAPHALVSIGPTVDVGLSGSSKIDDSTVTTTSEDIKETDIGFQASLLLYF